MPPGRLGILMKSCSVGVLTTNHVGCSLGTTTPKRCGAAFTLQAVPAAKITAFRDIHIYAAPEPCSNLLHSWSSQFRARAPNQRYHVASENHRPRHCRLLESNVERRLIGSLDRGMENTIFYYRHKRLDNGAFRSTHRSCMRHQFCVANCFRLHA